MPLSQLRFFLQVLAMTNLQIHLSYAMHCEYDKQNIYFQQGLTSQVFPAKFCMVLQVLFLDWSHQISAFILIQNIYSFCFLAANMFLIPFGMWQGADVSVGRYIWHSLIPTMIGNAIAPAFFLSGSYSFIYDKTPPRKSSFCNLLTILCLKAFLAFCLDWRAARVILQMPTLLLQILLWQHFLFGGALWNHHRVCVWELIVL